jgi:hypothetical protein
VADANGNDTRQITNLNCASFAPTFTPDGKQILFSSNRHDCGGRKFELYLVNPDGTNLRQVTNLGSFTSFSQFSSDGESSRSSLTGRLWRATNSTCSLPIGIQVETNEAASHPLRSIGGACDSTCAGDRAI